MTTIQAIPLILGNTVLSMMNTSGSNDKYTQFNNLADVSIQRRRVTSLHIPEEFVKPRQRKPMTQEL